MGNTVGKKEHSNDNPTENARDNVEEENTVIQSGEAVQEPDDNDVFGGTYVKIRLPKFFSPEVSLPCSWEAR
uniref:Golli protein TP8.1 n=1 Tax=Xenopus laevis TaxID=8355 RepID=B2ZZ75_XENLA|nr:golli protein TP8.1 [Xenopus laevis]